MQLNVYKAIERMRELSQAGVPFSFSFCTYNDSKINSSELRIVNKAQLRNSMSKNYSNKSDLLIEYIDLETNNKRHFNICMLISFNKFRITL